MLNCTHSLESLPSRFRCKIVLEARRAGFSACWCWTGRLNRNGYARAWWQGREPVLHRVAYELLIEEIPAGMILDHLCRQRDCINPEHMEPVTHRENTLRGEAVLFAPIQLKTHNQELTQ